MSINLNTYEEYLLDYIDGKLCPEVEAELVKFLRLHPDIASELDGLNQLTIPKPNLSFSGKQRLRRTVEQDLYSCNEMDYLCIAELEGDISEVEKARLEELKGQHPEVERFRNLYAHTLLLSENSHTFPNKASLKRHSIISKRRIMLTAAAAITAAIVGLHTIHKLSLPDDLQPQNQMAKSAIIESQPRENRPTSTTTYPQTQPKPESRLAVSLAYKTSTSTISMDNEELQPMRTNVAELKQIASKEPIIEPIASITPKPLPITGKVQGVAFREKELAPNVAPSTAKVYTLADIAGLSLKRLAGLVGISYNVKTDSTNTSKHIEVDSRLIAISTIIRKNN